MARKYTKAGQAKSGELATGPVCRLLMALAGDQVDREQLAEVFGNLKVRTLADVAKLFGVSASTPRQAWRANGMPGQQGEYSIGEIVAWLLERRLTEKQRQPQLDAVGIRKREIELRSAELDLQRKEREEQADTGRVVNVDSAMKELQALILVVKHMLQGIPRDVAPLLPTEVEATITGELTKALNRALLALAEGCGCIVGEAVIDLQAGKSLFQADTKVARLTKKGKPPNGQRRNFGNRVSSARGEAAATDPRDHDGNGG